MTADYEPRDNPRGDSDFLTALAIGAVVGIGAALLFRASDDLDREKIMKKLKPLKKRANHALHRASSEVSKTASRQMTKARKKAKHKMSDAAAAGRIVKRSSGKIARHTGDDISKIVEDARRELRNSARDSVRQAQRAMRRAAKKLV